MSALGLAQVLWDERQALSGKPLHFPPAPGAMDPLGDHSEAAKGDRNSASATESAPEPQPACLREIYKSLNSDNRWALCLSGGGIRSAAFALGVIQRLAALKVASKRPEEPPEPALQQFEYLSTVSGGGYIGSWLSSWLFQERKQRALTGPAPFSNTNAVIAALNRETDDLASVNGSLEDHQEAVPVSSLRRDSHYLAPSFSPLSPDLWSGIAGITRNLFLNWILLVPPMVLAVLLTKIVKYAMIDAGHVTQSLGWFHLMMVVAATCFIVALSFSVANRPARGLINAAQPLFLACDMTVFLVGAMLLSFVLVSPNGLETLSEVIRRGTGLRWFDEVESSSLERAVLIRATLLGITIHFVAWWVSTVAWRPVLGPARQAQAQVVSKWWHKWFDLGTWCVAGAGFGALVGAGLVLLWHLDQSDSNGLTQRFALACVFGVPWIVSARVIAEVIFVSFAEFVPGADAGLEYQARSSGIFTLASFGWLLWFGLVLLSPPVANWLQGHLGQWTTGWIAAAGGISGAFSVIIGASSKTKTVVRQVSSVRRYFGLNTIAAIAAAVFALVLVAMISIGCDWAFAFDPPHGAEHPSWLLVGTAVAVLAALIVVTSLVISINRYSLHSIYRNRLVRTFLGASRDQNERDKAKNAFTDFDSLDSPLLHHLWWGRDVAPRGADWRPLHVINAALNLVSSKNLAWQERMAAPFTFSPLHCGSGSSAFSHGAYRTSYATKLQKPYGGTLGLTLGTAMAISGAAVSPSMGYNSSPGVAFLMTLFNVRLGWWLANPRGENSYYWKTKPRVALRPLFMEMFGLTSETERWVYLSDGGHFENLGMYEMVRRRCRVIVVSDAGCDPDYSFEDLGNALRKIWIDLGVRIDLHGLDRLKKRFKDRPTPAAQEPYWAIGDILYEEADGGRSENGYLLYFKSGVHGTEPVGVLSYAMSHTSFPHETTANQFFTESQFESYRMLGYEIVERALEVGGGLSDQPRRLVSIIERLKEQIKACDRQARRADDVVSNFQYGPSERRQRRFCFSGVKMSMARRPP